MRAITTFRPLLLIGVDRMASQQAHIRTVATTTTTTKQNSTQLPTAMQHVFTEHAVHTSGTGHMQHAARQQQSMQQPQLEARCRYITGLRLITCTSISADQLTAPHFSFTTHVVHCGAASVHSRGHTCATVPLSALDTTNCRDTSTHPSFPRALCPTNRHMPPPSAKA